MSQIFQNSIVSELKSKFESFLEANIDNLKKHFFYFSDNEFSFSSQNISFADSFVFSDKKNQIDVCVAIFDINKNNCIADVTIKSYDPKNNFCITDVSDFFDYYTIDVVKSVLSSNVKNQQSFFRKKHNFTFKNILNYNYDKTINDIENENKEKKFVSAFEESRYLLRDINDSNIQLYKNLYHNFNIEDFSNILHYSYQIDKCLNNFSVEDIETLNISHDINIHKDLSLIKNNNTNKI